MIFSKKVAKPNHEVDLEYRVTTLPRNKDAVRSVFEALSGYSMVYFQPDYAYVIMRREGKMNEKKQYKIVELPNSTQKIEELLNAEYDQGYEVKFINDYSATLVRKEH